jgi:hypothetical protein
MLLNDGTIITCGSNKYGQLGVTNFKDTLSFEKQAKNNEEPLDIAESSSSSSESSSESNNNNGEISSKSSDTDRGEEKKRANEGGGVTTDE